MKRKSKKRSADPKIWLGGAMIVASLAVGAALLAAPLLAPRAPVDSANNCRTDQPPPRHTVILVDATEPLAARHKRLLTAAVDQARNSTMRYGRVSIVKLNADEPEEPIWLASECSPGKSEEANPFFANPDKIRARWASVFEAPLKQAAQRAGKRHEDASSQIAKTLIALSRDPRFAQDNQERSIVLVSDLLEHHPGVVSLYDPQAVFDPARDPVARLDGVKVEVVDIDRPKYAAAQATVWARFWEAWFDASGADVTRAP